MALAAVTHAAAHTFLGVSDSGWSAIAAWVGLVLAIIAARLGYGQWSEARRERQEQAQPYVAVYMEPSEVDPAAADLIVKNFGATAARDIRVSIDPPPRSAAHGDGLIVPGVLRTLVPGQHWSTFWDTTRHRKDADLPEHHVATVTFNDSHNRELGPYRFDLDWRQLSDRGWIETYGMHQLAGWVKDIRNDYRHRGDGRHSHVLVFDGDERHRQRMEAWEARREQEAAEESKQQPPPSAG